jgi:purine-binding chemotaxis protein CheW
LEVDLEHDLALLCRVRHRVCALPLRVVIETMRPLPIETMSGIPDAVLGVAVVRGEPTPVVDAARLLGDGGSAATTGRFVTLRVGTRTVALAVDEVLGVAPMPAAAAALPPLLAGAAGGVVDTIGALDRDFLVVLDAMRVVEAAVA